MTRDRAYELRNVISGAMQSVDDEIALENPTLFENWHEGVAYEAGFKLRYQGVLYKVLQNHTSQSDWTPDVAASLFARVLIPDESVIPDWEQPDSTNPYMTGDKVRFNGMVYESLIDNNIWSPADYPAGWQIVEE